MCPSQRSRSRGTRSLRASALPARRLKPPCLKASAPAPFPPVGLWLRARPACFVSLLRAKLSPAPGERKGESVAPDGLPASLRSCFFALPPRSATTRRNGKATAKAAAKKMSLRSCGLRLGALAQPFQGVKVKPPAPVVLRNLDPFHVCAVPQIRGAKNREGQHPPRPRTLAGERKGTL